MIIGEESKTPKNERVSFTHCLQSGSDIIERLQITTLSPRGGYLSKNDFENNFPVHSNHHILLSNETKGLALLTRHENVLL